MPARLVAETKAMREQIQTLEKSAAEYEARMQQILDGIPNLAE